MNCRCCAEHTVWRPIFHNSIRISSWLLSFLRQRPVVLIQQKALMDDQGGCDLGSCFHFILDIKYLGEWKNASPITALALEVGNGQCGCSQLTQMQNHPGANKPPESQRFDLVPSRPWHLSASSLSLSLMMTQFSFNAAFWPLLFQSCLLSELWLFYRIIRGRGS